LSRVAAAPHHAFWRLAKNFGPLDQKLVVSNFAV
jgi:hypothetical protein